MLKLTVAVLALALAGTAAAGWRDLRVDASSGEAFAQSMAEFKKELSPERLSVFNQALTDIWNQNARAAEADQRQYTADEYYKLLDGLRYEEVVTYTDPTGETAKTRYRDATESAHRSHAPAPQTPRPFADNGGVRWGTDPTRADTQRNSSIGVCRRVTKTGDLEC